MNPGEMSAPATAVRDAGHIRTLLRASSRAIATLLRERDFDRAVSESLGILGKGAGADRAYLFRIRYDSAGSGWMSQRFEWNSGQAAPQIDNAELQNLSFDTIPAFIAPLVKGEIFHGKVSDFDESIRAILEPQKILSLIILPVMVDDVFWGFTGFDDCSVGHVWDEDELSILFSYTSALGTMVERTEGENRLRAAMASAESANKAKSAFVANVSHEIRTPLNAILGFAELVIDRTADPKLKEYGEGISIAGHNLLSLINDILDLSKIEANRLEIRPRAISLPALLSEMRSVFSLKADEKRLAYEVVISGTLPETIITDPTRIRQILFNLIGNAFKYTEQGYVRLGCSAQPSGMNRVDIEISVADSGIGIPENQQINIFEAFRQQEDDSTRKHGGTGLGLTIARRIANLMGGRITVQSVPGEGSVFTIHLPGIPVTEARRVHEEAPAKNRTFAPAVILLVDDIAANRAVVRGYLENSAIRLVEARNGEEALKSASETKPDMIFMDMEMPVMDGRTALRKLRENLSTSRIPVVALTASALGRDEDDIKALCEGYLRKPVSKNELFAEMARFLESENTKTPDRTPADTVVSQAAETARAGLFPSHRIYRALFEEKWRHAAELLSIDDLGVFAGDLAIEATKLDDEAAMKYAAELSDACASFDLIRMEEVFARFPELAGFAGPATVAP